MTATQDESEKLTRQLLSGFTRLQDCLENSTEKSAVAAEFKKFIDLALTGSTPKVVSAGELITTGEAADILWVSRPTVVAWINKGKLNSVRHGTHRRLLAKEVHELASKLEKQRDEALTEFLNS